MLRERVVWPRWGECLRQRPAGGGGGSWQAEGRGGGGSYVSVIQS